MLGRDDLKWELRYFSVISTPHFALKTNKTLQPCTKIHHFPAIWPELLASWVMSCIEMQKADPGLSGNDLAPLHLTSSIIYKYVYVCVSKCVNSKQYVKCMYLISVTEPKSWQWNWTCKCPVEWIYIVHTLGWEIVRASIWKTRMTWHARCELVNWGAETQ